MVGDTAFIVPNKANVEDRKTYACIYIYVYAYVRKIPYSPLKRGVLIWQSSMQVMRNSSRIYCSLCKTDT